MSQEKGGSLLGSKAGILLASLLISCVWMDSYSIFTLRLPLLGILTVKLCGPSYHHILGPP